MGKASIDSEEFGQRLRSLRKAAGLTQKELGGARFSHAYISSLESGRRSPSAAALLFLSERLHTNLSAVLIPGSDGLTEALEHLPTAGPIARRLLTDILRSIDRSPNPRLTADVLRSIGESRLVDAPLIGESLLVKALEIYRTSPGARRDGDGGMARTLFLLAEAATIRREIARALSLYREAAALFIDSEGS